jgi:hypothetical protein
MAPRFLRFQRHPGGWAAAIVVGILTATSAAHAQATLTGRAFTGYSPAHGYGWGIGGDVGVQFPFLFGTPMAIGGFLDYHFGNEFTDEEIGETVEQRIAFYGAHASSLWVDKAVFLRGSGQAGAAVVRREVEGAASVTQTRFFLGGGIMVGKRVGDFVISVEPWFPIVINSDYTTAAVAFYLNVVFQPPLIR